MRRRPKPARLHEPGQPGRYRAAHVVGEVEEAALLAITHHRGMQQPFLSHELLLLFGWHQTVIRGNRHAAGAKRKDRDRDSGEADHRSTRFPELFGERVVMTGRTKSRDPHLIHQSSRRDPRPGRWDPVEAQGHGRPRLRRPGRLASAPSCRAQHRQRRHCSASHGRNPQELFERTASSTSIAGIGGQGEPVV